MTSTPTVALLGTGTMGAGMARNIASAGLPLRNGDVTVSPFAKIFFTLLG